MDTTQIEISRARAAEERRRANQAYRTRPLRPEVPVATFFAAAEAAEAAVGAALVDGLLAMLQETGGVLCAPRESGTRNEVRGARTPLEWWVYCPDISMAVPTRRRRGGAVHFEALNLQGPVPAQPPEMALACLAGECGTDFSRAPAQIELWGAGKGPVVAAWPRLGQYPHEAGATPESLAEELRLQTPEGQRELARRLITGTVIQPATLLTLARSAGWDPDPAPTPCPPGWRW